MKALFVYDLPIIFSNGQYLSRYGTNDSMFERYNVISDSLTIIGRQDFASESNIPKETDNRYSLITKYRIVLFSRKYQNLAKRLRFEIFNSSFIILRLPSISGILGYFYCRRFRKNFLVELVGDTSSSLKYHGSKIAAFLEPFYTFMIKKIVRKAPYVMYVSQYFLQRKYPNKKLNIGCPDVVINPPLETVLQNRLQKIDGSSEIFVLGLIGSLDVKYRGHNLLLEVLRLCRLRNYNFFVRFLGAGDSTSLNKEAKRLGVLEYVEYSGFVPSGEPVLAWIDEIDILVMPTKAETLGRAIIESMSRGCPVIGSYETAIPEQIGGDCVFSSDDVGGFYNKIVSMYNDKEYMKLCAIENFYRAHKYTEKFIATKRNSFYQMILNEIKGGE